MKATPLQQTPSGGSDHRLVRPSLADLTALEIRCARAEGKSAIHAVESALKWMRDLLAAPTWTPALQQSWDMYRRGIDHALSGRPNAYSRDPGQHNENQKAHETNE